MICKSSVSFPSFPARWSSGNTGISAIVRDTVGVGNAGFTEEIRKRSWGALKGPLLKPPLPRPRPRPKLPPNLFSRGGPNKDFAKSSFPAFVSPNPWPEVDANAPPLSSTGLENTNSRSLLDAMRFPASALVSFGREGPAPSLPANAKPPFPPSPPVPSALLTKPPPPSLITFSIVRFSLVDFKYVDICISEKSRMFPASCWKCSRFSATRRSRIFSITSICTLGGNEANTAGSMSSASGMKMSSSSDSNSDDSDASASSHSGSSSNNTIAFAFVSSFVKSTSFRVPLVAGPPVFGVEVGPELAPAQLLLLNASLSADCFIALRSSFSAVRRTWPCLFSRTRRRAAVVRRFSAGVAPSKTNIGEMRWYNKRQMRRKNPMRCALGSMSPRSSRMALMNCTSQMLASTATLLPPSVSMFTRRPVGSSKLQRFLTPMAFARCRA